jgi:glycosyltransferase involved in cell wall biosynthesis
LNILIIHEIDWINKVIFEPHHISELLSLQGHEVFVIDCRDANIKKLKNAIKTEEIKDFHRVYDNSSITLIRPPSISIRGLNRISNFLFCKKIIYETIVKNKIDVILLYGTATNGIQTINIAEKLDIPVFYRLLDITHSLVKTPIIRQLAKKNESTVIRKATKVLPIIPDLQRYAIEMGAIKENTSVFPLGINRKLFKKLPKNKKLLQELKINEKDKVILFVGTLFEFSGLEKIIKKYKIILNKNPNTKFLIVGGGAQFNRLDSLIKEKNLEPNIIMTGFLPQQIIPEYISLADICIQPFETNYITNRILPSKILEYFACGKAVLSTPLDGTVEILPDEKFGIIYATQNDFVKKLSELLTDDTKLEELGKQGYEYVIHNHDWDILSNKIIEKFESIKSKF